MGRFGTSSAVTLAIGCAALAASGAQAETLDVQGVYAANVDLPGGIETIVIDSLRGELGGDGEIAIQQELGSASVDGTLFFKVLRADAPMTGATVTVGGQESVRSAIDPDAILAGTVRGDIIQRRLEPRIRTECVERDDNDKCIRSEEFPIPCRELTVQVMPRLLLTTNDGEQIYSNNEPLFQTERYCRNDAVIPSALDIESDLIDQLARNIRFDLAPVERFERVRIMESRKDLVREDRDAFRQAVRLTKTDQAAACDAFADLEQGNPMQVSVLFNIGLCQEASGDLEAARAYYKRALAVSPRRDSPTQGLNRIASRERAAVQLAAREKAEVETEEQNEAGNKD
jgi:hypothetical protein